MEKKGMLGLRVSRGNRVVKISAPLIAVVIVLAFVLVNVFTAQAANLHKKYKFVDTNYAVPSANVAWMAPDGSDATGNGSQASPYASFKRALQAVSDGGTVVAKTGIYREPHFHVTKNNITFQAAPHAEVWLKGSDVVGSSAWTKEGGLWKSTGDYFNFCHVCTENKNPSKEGMAAYPEQVFINDEPLTQVASKAEVRAGTFYVEDNTPTTLKVANDNTKGYNVGAQDQITYYLGSDPTAGTTEISQRHRAFSVGSTVTGFAMKAINVAQYAPLQSWKWDYQPANDQPGTSMVVVNGKNSLVQDSIFTQSAAVGFNTDGESGRITNNTFVGNGANGSGANRAHGTIYEGNTFSNNNTAGFLTNGSVCIEACTVSDVKVTHIENFTFRNNIIDYSNSAAATANADSVRNGTPGFWCDEGCINTKVVGNFFTNAGTAIVDEVSHGTIIASNIIEGSGAGISVSGSSDVKLYNNTISRTNRPIMLNEDDRTDGCNARNASGDCIAPEGWSQQKGLSWNLTGLEMYNNIISSRAVISGDSSGPLWSYPVRTVGRENQTGSGIYTNDMFKGFDNNAYYRSSQAGENTIFTWDLANVADPINILFARVADISTDSRVSSSIAGRDANSLDLFGSRANNPYFIKEASGNTDYKQSNYNLKSGSPAIGSGVALSSAVAAAIDPSGTIVHSGAAVNRGALVNVMMDATNSPAPVGVVIPDNNLRRLLNQNLASVLGVARTDDQAITAEEMSRVTALYADASDTTPANSKVANLTGLEHATNLTALSLGGHAITNLAPIASLSKLESLQIHNNNITSIQPIAGLANLSMINASGNPITDYSPFTNLSKLTQVSLSSQNVTLDMTHFAASKATLTRFAYYDYGRTTNITNLSALAGATKLNYLRLTGVRLTSDDVSRIGSLSSLTTLRLDYSNVADVSPLAGLGNLTTLDLGSQNASTTAVTESFNSPLKDATGAIVPVANSSTLVNDGDRLKLVSPQYDNQPHEAQANWSKSVSIGSATTTFSGTLKVVATLPKKADLTALQAAISAAEEEPSYIQSDSAVAAALATAKNLVAQANPSETAVESATNTLNAAVAAAKRKEADAQSAAETAVAQAERSKDPDDVIGAKTKVDAVQDVAKRQAFQARLDAVTSAVAAARQALVTLIADAKKPSTTAGMSGATVAALNAQIIEAQRIVDNSGASVAELNAAKDALQAKINALVTDKTALQAAIASAEAEPGYIRLDSAVAAALANAKNLASQASPSVGSMQTAISNLNNAIAAAKQKESNAQAAAEVAVAKAESEKTQSSVDAAKVLLAKVQDPAKKATLQARLNAIVISPAPGVPKNSAVIAQSNGRSVKLETSGDACFNLASAKAASAPARYNRYVLRDVADFTVDCTNQAAAVGFTTQVTITLNQLYRNTSRLTIAKIANGNIQQNITSHATFGVTGDGKYTTVTYRLTDGGFGDQDKRANGVIVDPVGIYEEEDDSNPVSAVVNNAARALAATGDNAIFVALTAIAVGAGGIWLVRRR